MVDEVTDSVVELIIGTVDVTISVFVEGLFAASDVTIVDVVVPVIVEVPKSTVVDE